MPRNLRDNAPGPIDPVSPGSAKFDLVSKLCFMPERNRVLRTITEVLRNYRP